MVILNAYKPIPKIKRIEMYFSVSGMNTMP